jgi:Domain of unknown function (DUF4328)
MYHDGAGCIVSSCGCKKKGKEFGGEGNAPWDALYRPHSFRSISKVTDWLVRFNIALIIITVISSGATIYLTFSTEYVQFLPVFSVVGAFSGIISFLEFITSLFWYYRATKNIQSFGAKTVTSPIMAAIWWFIPIFFFWKPYNVTQQIWKASNPEIMLTEGIEWKRSQSSKMIRQWWVLYLISITGAVIVALIGYTSFGTEHNMQAGELGQPLGSILDLLGIPFQAIGIISIILFIRIIKQISAWQYRKSINV